MSIVNNGFTLQEILFLVGFQARTGELVLESGNNIGSLLVRGGAILHAYSPYSRAIGDLLVEQGVLTEGELLESLNEQKKNPDIPLGMMLLRTGKVNFGMIEKLVHEQIRKAMEDFASWEDVTFSFFAKDVMPFDRIQILISEFIRPEIIKTVLTFLGNEMASPPLSRTATTQASPSSSRQ